MVRCLKPQQPRLPFLATPPFSPSPIFQSLTLGSHVLGRWDGGWAGTQGSLSFCAWADGVMFDKRCAFYETDRLCLLRTPHPPTPAHLFMGGLDLACSSLNRRPEHVGLPRPSWGPSPSSQCLFHCTSPGCDEICKVRLRLAITLETAPVRDSQA